MSVPTPQVKILLRGAWDEIWKWNYIDVEGWGIHPGTQGVIRGYKIYPRPPSLAPRF